MIKFKKKKIVDCIVKKSFKNFKIGDIIKIPIGYSQWLLKKDIVYSVNNKCSIENVLNKKVFVKLEDEIQKFKNLSVFTISRKTKRREDTLFQKITAEQVIQGICKQNNINYFTCFRAEIVSKNEILTAILSCGNYDFNIYCKDEKIISIRIVVVSSN